MGKRRRQHPEFDAYDPLIDDDASETIDLHGMTAPEARQHLEQVLRRLAARNRGRVVHVITGRGNRSQAGAVLRPMVLRMLKGPLSSLVHDVQDDATGGGFRIRLT